MGLFKKNIIDCTKNDLTKVLEKYEGLNNQATQELIKRASSILHQIKKIRGEDFEKPDYIVRHHWNFLHNEILQTIENQEQEAALKLINLAINHLIAKIYCGFSLAANTFGMFQTLPFAEGFSKYAASNRREQGVNKTGERLGKIGAWLQEINHNLSASYHPANTRR